MRSIGCLLVLMALLTAVGWSQEQNAGWALVIGVNQYDSGDIASLSYAEADATEFARTLVENCGYPSDHVLVLTSGGKDKLRASRANILYWLSRIRLLARPSESFVFFFAGHGVSLEKESYLLPTDAIAETSDTLEDSGLKVSRLRSLLDDIQASRKLVALDACRNDPRAGRGSGDNTLAPLMARGLEIRPAPPSGTDQPEVAATIFACRVGERSYEWAEKHHGFFSYYLIRGLQGAARNANGVVTLPSLLDYLETRVPQQLKVWKGSPLQTPWAETSGTGSGQWVLSRPVSTSVASDNNAGAQPGLTAMPSTSTSPLGPAEPSTALKDAEAAFDAGQFGEPETRCAIDLCRTVLHDDPGNAQARALEARACEAYENQARLALLGGDKQRAAAIYHRLLALYPDREAYVKALEDLSSKPATAPDITGNWSTMGGTAAFRADGSITYSGFLVVTIRGTWQCIDPARKMFRFTWNHGFIDTVTLSEDGRRMTGTNQKGEQVTFSR